MHENNNYLNVTDMELM